MKRWIIGIVTIILLAGAGSYVVYAVQPEPVKPVVVKEVPLNADTIFTLVNAERTKAGVKPLIRNAILDQTAQDKATDMDKNNYFSHFRPGATTNYVWDNPIWAQMCVRNSENIGWNSGHSDDNVSQLKWWMNSKAHHDAILNPGYTLTGVAVSSDKVVQHFCIAK